LGIKNVHVEFSPHLPDRLLDALFYNVIIGKCKQLRSLEFVVNDRMELFRNTHLKQLAKSAVGKSLQELSLHNCSFLTAKNGFYKIAKFMQNLSLLDLSGCSFLDDENIYQMSRALPYLQTLSISKCNNLTDVALMYISTPEGVFEDSATSIASEDIEELPHHDMSPNHFVYNITDLDISFCPFTEKAIENVGKYMHQLEHFDLRSIGKMTDYGVMYLRSLVNLKSLALGVDFKILSGTEHIEIINRGIITADHHASTSIDSVLESMLSRLTNLDSSVPSDRYITDYSMINICTALTKIEMLRLKYCMALSPSTVMMIANNMCGLHVLDLEGCRRAISDQSLAALFTQCCFLEDLTLSVMGKRFGNSFFDTQLRINSSDVTQPLDVPISKNLKKLDMNASMLSDHHVKFAVNMMQGLTWLDLSRNHCITDQSLVYIVHALKNIRFLNIVNCNVSTVAVRRLLKYCTSLRTLVIDDELFDYLHELDRSIKIFPEWIEFFLVEQDEEMSPEMWQKIVVE
jgi:hypothetical protein